MNELKKQLTVRPNENAIGIRPPSFKVYRELPGGKLLIPRFFNDESASAAKISKGVAVSVNFTGKLRDYQKEAVSKFKGNGVLCLGCGYGKTITALAISSKLKRKTLIVVHKEFLANQWRERIAQFCPGSTE